MTTLHWMAAHWAVITAATLWMLGARLSFWLATEGGRPEPLWAYLTWPVWVAILLGIETMESVHFLWGRRR